MKISKREKIVLGLTVLALLYAGVVFLFPGHDGAVSQLEIDENSINGLVTEVTRSLAQHHLSEAEQAILEKAQVPWPSEPFVAAGLPSPGEREPGGETTVEADSESFSFTGYIEIGTRRLAIINGEEYETGDRITGSPFMVRGISPEQILLGDAGNRTRVIPIAGDSAP